MPFIYYLQIIFVRWCKLHDVVRPTKSITSLTHVRSHWLAEDEQCRHRPSRNYVPRNYVRRTLIPSQRETKALWSRRGGNLHRVPKSLRGSFDASAYPHPRIVPSLSRLINFAVSPLSGALSTYRKLTNYVNFFLALTFAIFFRADVLIEMIRRSNPPIVFKP